MAMMMGNQDYRNAQLNSSANAEVNQQLLVSSQVTPAKIVQQENAEVVGEKGDGSQSNPADPEANADNGSLKQNLDIEMKLENLGENAQDVEMKEAADPKGLSPMTRRSDRARQDVDYIGLIRGNGRSAAGEVDLTGLG